LTPQELKLLETGPSIKNWPISLAIGLGLFATGAASFVLLIFPFQVAMLISAVGVALTVWPTIVASNTEFVVTHTRIYRRFELGIKRESEVPLAAVAEIRIRRSKMQKMLDLGDIEIVTSGSGTLELDGVEEPEAVRDRILSLR